MQLQLPTPHATAAPGIAAFLDTTWTSDVRIDGTPISELVDSLVRFDLRGDGPLPARELVPTTRAARDLLASPDGPRVSAALRGYLALGETQEGRADVRGVAFSNSEQAMALNALISHVVDNAVPIAPGTEAGRLDLQRWADEMWHAVEGSPMLAIAYPTLCFGPTISRNFLTQAGAPSADPAERASAAGSLRTMTHEIEHRITPLDGDAGPDWTDAQLTAASMLEEGTASLVSRLPGHLEQAARATGLPLSADPPRTYAPYVEALTELLHRAGIDTADPAQADAVRALLQGAPSIRVPDRAAALIARRHHLTADQRSQVRDRFLAIPAHDHDAADDANSTVDAYHAWEERFRARTTTAFADIDAIIDAAAPATSA